jgi:hypothetical protein
VWRDGDSRAASLAKMDDAVVELGRPHCEVADRADLWRLWALLHVALGYRQRNARFDLNQEGAAAWDQ